MGRGPVPEAGDRVMVERIRSVLGPIERRLGLEPVEVAVADRVATLRGSVPDESDVAVVVAAAAGVAGVREVRSDLGRPFPSPPNGTSGHDGGG